MADGDAPPATPAGAAPSFHVDGYELGDVIGQGGFGVVHRARDLAFGRDVAIKVMAVVLDDQARARFDRERRALGAASGHPNIVDVHTSGIDEHGRPYLVMEYMTHGSLADRLDQAGPVRWQDALDAIVKIAGALETAHRVGVLHRDVKPANVLVSAYGEPALADFGIARISGASTLTAAGMLMFSPLHAAPELLGGEPASVESDVYSLASTLFALIAGQAAFEHDDDNRVTMLRRIVLEPLPDLRRLGVPRDVQRVLEHAMTKDAARRPRSAGEFGGELRDVQRRLGLAVTPMHVIGDATSGRAAAPRCLVVDGQTRYALDRDHVIGREPQHDPDVRAGHARAVVLPSGDRTISRSHARIVIDGGAVGILDQSANGTYIRAPGDDTWLRVSGPDAVPIEPGTSIVIGTTTMLVEADGE